MTDAQGRPTADELAQSFLEAAEAAAKERLNKCAEVLFDDADGGELEGPFCGCDVCVVREILAAAMPHLEKHFEVVLFTRLGFEIDWGASEDSPT